MDDFDKCITASIITFILGVVGMVCFVKYSGDITKQIAIKQGLVQKVDQAQIIWTKP